MKISLTLSDEGLVQAQPREFLGAELFEKYKTACTEGGGKTKKNALGHWFNEFSLQAAPRIIQSLKDAGFAVVGSPDLHARIQAFADQTRSDVIHASTRAAELDARLQKKGLSLFGFQHRGVEWLAPRTSALLLDQMGLGKTLQALAACPNAPVLVISPAVAKGVWLRETKKWREDLKVTVLQGRASFRWPTAGELVATNYDILPDVEKLPVPPPGVVVICDEVHAIKNSKSRRTIRTRAVLAAARTAGGRTWGLTATPMLNKPQELWNLLVAFGLEREVFGKWPRFVTLFNGTKDDWGGMHWGTPEPEVATLLQRVSLRRERQEVLKDLPPKTRVGHAVELSKKLTKSLDKVWAKIEKSKAPWDAIFAGVESGSASKGSIPFEEISAARAELARAKIPALLELVEAYEEQEEPLVVFSAHLAPLHELAKRPGWALITGATPPHKRTEIENDFQAGKLKGIGASFQAGGVAITLTYAAHAICVDLAWTPALNEQAEDRLLRIGQVRAVLITRLIANHPLDERVMELLTEKQALINGSVGAAAVGAREVLPDLSKAVEALVH